MRTCISSWWVPLVLLGLAVSTTAYGQTGATLQGRVLDQSGAAVPAASIIVRDQSKGYERSSTADAEGRYQIDGIPAGTYAIVADAAGFRPATIEQLNLEVGRTLTRDFSLSVGDRQETVVVEGPLVDPASSEVGGNLDRRRMEDVPLAGRNWVELALQVRGNTGNDAHSRPGVSSDSAFQLNLDGQPVTNRVATSDTFGQPRFSAESIAEFRVAANLYSVAEGRSTGLQIQAVSRTGTNSLSGSVYGHFRDQKLTARDFIAKRVLPYENQQLGVTLGGPFVKGKWFYFGSYEYEREPTTAVFRPANLPGQSFEYANRQVSHNALIRVDQHASAASRLSYRVAIWDYARPVDKFGEHPTQASTLSRHADNVLLTWSHVRGPSSIEEVRLGFNSYGWHNGFAIPAMATTPTYNFLGGPIGGISSYPQRFKQWMVTARYDMSTTRGPHLIKLGGEFLWWNTTGEWRLVERGIYNFHTNPPDLDRRIPADAIDQPARWDLSGLDAYATNFLQNVGDWNVDVPRPVYAIWLGDAWRVNDRLSVDVGVRYDVDPGATSPPGVSSRARFAPLDGPLYKPEITDVDNIAPRGSLTWRARGENLVIRGGSGLYYGTIVSNVAFLEQSYARITVNSFANDGLPGWFDDPTRGFTAEQIRAGAVPQAPTVIAHDFELPVTWQSSLGFHSQLQPRLSIESDVIHWKEYNRPRARDINLVLDTATGYPALGRVADPDWGPVLWVESKAQADSLKLANAVHGRFAAGGAVDVAYTLTLYARDNQPGQRVFANADNPLNVDAPSEWARSQEFQRHTVRLSGIWPIGHDVTVAAVYHVGSGNYFNTSVAGNPYGKSRAWSSLTNRLYLGPSFAVGGVAGRRYDGPAVLDDGDVVPRNALKGLAIQKLDVRVAKSIRVGSIQLQGSIEVFNVLNHENYGSYNAVVTSPEFGLPQQHAANTYQPRMGQIAIRVRY